MSNEAQKEPKKGKEYEFSDDNKTWHKMTYIGLNPIESTKCKFFATETEEPETATAFRYCRETNESYGYYFAKMNEDSDTMIIQKCADGIYMMAIQTPLSKEFFHWISEEKISVTPTQKMGPDGFTHAQIEILHSEVRNLTERDDISCAFNKLLGNVGNSQA